jgi:hypothetical protein
MFPLGFIFLLCALARQRDLRKSLQNVTISTVIFLAIAAPLCAAISIREHRLTFGDSGAWNYALYVDGMPYWAPDATATSKRPVKLQHPMQRLVPSVPLYDFGDAVGGTFPPWYDPVYWHEGFGTTLAIRADLQVLWESLQTYSEILFLFFWSTCVGAFVLYFASDGVWPSLRRTLRYWPVALPCVGTLLLYAPVHVEGRFIAAPVAALFLIAYAGVRQNSSSPRARLVPLTVTAVAAVLLLTVVVAPKIQWPGSTTVYAYPRLTGPVYAEAADALRRSGVQAHDKIALIWNEKWAHGAVQGAFVPRLLRARIVAEVTDPDAFWKADAATRDSAIEALRRTGVRAILARGIPDSAQQGWSRLGDTNYFAYLFQAPVSAQDDGVFR